MAPDAAGTSNASMLHAIRRFAVYLKPDSARLLVNAVVIQGTIPSSGINLNSEQGFDLLHADRFADFKRAISLRSPRSW